MDKQARTRVRLKGILRLSEALALASVSSESVNQLDGGHEDTATLRE